MKEIIKKIDFWYVAIILLTLIFSIIYGNKIPFPLSDVGRELYFPMEILDGKVLYKDIFNLFGPFPYLFTAFIFKIFGASISTFYGIGNACVLLLVTGVYMLSRKFMSKMFSSVICIYVIVTGIITITNFSYITPYASAMLYGVIAFLYSLYFYIRGAETEEIKYFYISSLLAGVAVANKYEFIFYVIFLLILFIIRYKNSISKIIKLIFLMAFPCLAGYLSLFVQGLTFNELVNHFRTLITLLGTNGYHHLYKGAGAIPDKRVFAKCIDKMFIAILVMSQAYLGIIIFKKQKILSIALIVIAFVSYARSLPDAKIPIFALAYLPMLMLFLFIISFKKLDGKERFTCISTLLVSYKVFFLMSINFYGVFFAPFILISMYILLKSEKLKAAFSLILLIVTVYVFRWTVYNFGIAKTIPIGVHGNQIYTQNDTGHVINSTVEYIYENTKPTDKIIVYPEGNIINVLTGRKSDDYYYALSPAYLEAWGEDNLIKYFSDEKNKPEYFIFTNESMHSYGKRNLCFDYGNNFCDYVKNNYTLEKVVVGAYIRRDRYVIYKKR